MQRGDVAVVVGDDARHAGDDPGAVLVLDEQREEGAGEARLEAVDVEDAHEAAAQAGSGHVDAFVAGLEVEAHRVRVHVAQVAGADLDLEPGGLGMIHRIAQPLVVGTESEQPADQGEVGAVTARGLRERAVQRQLGLAGRLQQRVARQQREAAGTCGVRTGGADHHGADHVEQSHARV